MSDERAKRREENPRHVFSMSLQSSVHAEQFLLPENVFLNGFCISVALEQDYYENALFYMM